MIPLPSIRTVIRVTVLGMVALAAWTIGALQATRPARIAEVECAAVVRRVVGVEAQARILGVALRRANEIFAMQGAPSMVAREVGR